MLAKVGGVDHSFPPVSLAMTWEEEVDELQGMVANALRTKRLDPRELAARAGICLATVRQFVERRANYCPRISTVFGLKRALGYRNGTMPESAGMQPDEIDMSQFRSRRGAWKRFKKDKKGKRPARRSKRSLAKRPPRRR